MVMLGDNVEVIVEFIYLIVFEEGIKFLICEGGRIVVFGLVVKIFVD